MIDYNSLKLPTIKGPCIYLFKFKNNHRIYIGSTKKYFIGRKSDHVRKLKQKIHKNRFLQRAANKYGIIDNIDAFIIEYIQNINELLVREEYWITYYDSANPRKGFNLVKTPTMFTGSGVKWTEEAKRKAYKKNEQLHARTYTFYSPDGRKIQIFNLRKFCTKNNLNYNAMISVVLDKSPEYNGWKVNLNRKNEVTKTFDLISPDGKEITITNLTKFCKENDLSPQLMHSAIMGRQIAHKGWKPKNGRISKRYKEYRFISPSGEVVTTTSLGDFAKKYNLNRAYVGVVASGQRPSVGGWISGDHNRENKSIRKYTLRNPSGEIVTIINMEKFCRELSLNPGLMRQLSYKKIANYKGWTTI